MKKNKKKKKNVTIQKTFEIAVLLLTQDQNFNCKTIDNINIHKYEEKMV